MHAPCHPINHPLVNQNVHATTPFPQHCVQCFRSSRAVNPPSTRRCEFDFAPNINQQFRAGSPEPTHEHIATRTQWTASGKTTSEVHMELHEVGTN